MSAWEEERCPTFPEMYPCFPAGHRPFIYPGCGQRRVPGHTARLPDAGRARGSPMDIAGRRRRWPCPLRPPNRSPQPRPPRRGPSRRRAGVRQRTPRGGRAAGASPKRSSSDGLPDGVAVDGRARFESPGSEERVRRVRISAELAAASARRDRLEASSRWGGRGGRRRPLGDERTGRPMCPQSTGVQRRRDRSAATPPCRGGGVGRFLGAGRRGGAACTRRR